MKALTSDIKSKVKNRLSVFRGGHHPRPLHTHQRDEHEVVKPMLLELFFRDGWECFHWTATKMPREVIHAGNREVLYLILNGYRKDFQPDP